MACRKAALREETRNRNAAVAAATAESMAVGDALLFATMCIIGMPVEAHATDGSIYSGTFHTASVDNDYAIVLKKAKMIKKGSQDVNVVEGSLIKTLIVKSEDLVQVVAKGVLLPSNRVGNVGRDGIQTIVGHNKHVDEEVKVSNESKSKVSKKHRSQRRLLAKRENGFPASSTAKTSNVLNGSLEECNEKLDTIQSVEIKEANNVSVGRRQVENGSAEIQDDSRSSPELQDERTTRDDQNSNISTQSSETVNIQEETSMRQISAETAKESKLNPGANTFSPTIEHNNRSGTPPMVPNGASYMPDTYDTMPPNPNVNTQQAVDANSFYCPPDKYIPNNNTNIGIFGYGTQYVQPMMGQMPQPIRYAGQYNYLTGAPYYHPNPQNVMYGQARPVVYMHPIPNGVAQSEARPVLNPYQMHHLPKHQGNVLAQQQQPYVMSYGPQQQPYVMPYGHQQQQQPYVMPYGPQQQPPYVVMPGSVPVPQPLCPVSRGPGSNGYSKH